MNKGIKMVILDLFIATGLIVPYAALIMFIARNGFDIPLLVSQMFGSLGATFFTLDVIVTALFVIYLVLTDERVKRVKGWLALATVLVGPSFAAPLYVKLRMKGQVINEGKLL